MTGSKGRDRKGKEGKIWKKEQTGIIKERKWRNIKGKERKTRVRK